MAAAEPQRLRCARRPSGSGRRRSRWGGRRSEEQQQEQRDEGEGRQVSAAVGRSGGHQGSFWSPEGATAWPRRALRRRSLSGGDLQALPLQVLDGLLLGLLDRGDERALAGQGGLEAVVEVLVGGVDRRDPLPPVVDALSACAKTSLYFWPPKNGDGLSSEEPLYPSIAAGQPYPPCISRSTLRDRCSARRRTSWPRGCAWRP